MAQNWLDQSSKKISRALPVERVYAVLLSLILFLAPTNLFLKFALSSGYVNGLLSDYLLPKLYFSDIFILLLLCTWAVSVWQKKEKLNIRWSKISRKTFWFFIAVGVLFFGRQFFASKPLAAIWYFAKLVEMSVFAIFLFRHRQFFNTKIVRATLLTTVLFQSIVGLLQFFTQKSVFPNYLFFGEINLSHRIGLAKGIFDGVEKILPYGTTAHPNVLAGFLALSMLVIFAHWRRQKKMPLLVVGIFGLASVTLFLTQSVAAWAGLGIGLTILFFGKKKFVLNRIAILTIFFVFAIVSPIFIHCAALVFPNVPSLTRRDQLNQAALNMFVHQPFFGVGLNNFTAQVERYNHSDEVVRFIQPAHHMGLLWLAETGIVGVLFLIFFTFFVSIQKESIQKKLSRNFPYFICLFPMIFFDHYLLTLQSGLLILVWSGVYFWSEF
jgi:O-antigen ligase